MLKVHSLLSPVATKAPQSFVGILSKAAEGTASKANGLWESLKTNLANFVNWVRTGFSSLVAAVRTYTQMKPWTAGALFTAAGVLIGVIAARVFTGKKEEKTDEKKEVKVEEKTTEVKKEEVKKDEAKTDVPPTPKADTKPPEEQKSAN